MLSWPSFVCFIGPRGAWLSRLSALEQWNPVFMLLALGLIGMGFYQSYQQEQVDCEESSLCARPAVKKSTKAALWLSAILVSLILAGPYLAPQVLAGNRHNNQVLANQTQTVFQVSGMTCVACTSTIETALRQVNGVSQAQVSLTPPEAKVSYDPKVTNSQALLKAIQRAGYSATEVSK